MIVNTKVTYTALIPFQLLTNASNAIVSIYINPFMIIYALLFDPKIGMLSEIRPYKSFKHHGIKIMDCKN